MVDAMRQRRMRDEPQVDETALVEACGRGDRAALSALFERFHLDVYRFLARMMGRHAREVEDLVQMTFLELARSAARFRGNSQVRSWIFGIASNVARRFVRDEARRQRLLSTIASDALTTLASSDRPSARSERLRVALAQLPHELRVVFVMCGIEGVSGAEASAALDVPVGTIWRRLHEARNALSDALGGPR